MKNYLVIGILLFMFSCATHKANRTNEYIYWVNSAKVPCKDFGAMQCLKVQKGDTLNSEKWEIFYAGIDGFDYQPGYIYKIKVRKKNTAKGNIPTDGSSVKFKLIKVLEKRQDARLLLNDIWILVSIQDETIEQSAENERRKTPHIEFNIADMRVAGNDGCNNFSGSIKDISLKKLTIGQLMGTKMACTETDIPDKFNTALNKVSKYKIENSHLFLYDDSENELLAFKKID